MIGSANLISSFLMGPDKPDPAGPDPEIPGYKRLGYPTLEAYITSPEFLAHLSAPELEPTMPELPPEEIRALIDQHFQEALLQKVVLYDVFHPLLTDTGPDDLDPLERLVFAMDSARALYAVEREEALPETENELIRLYQILVKNAGGQFTSPTVVASWLAEVSGLEQAKEKFAQGFAGEVAKRYLFDQILESGDLGWMEKPLFGRIYKFIVAGTELKS